MFIITVVILLIDVNIPLMVRVAISELAVDFQVKLFCNCAGSPAFTFMHLHYDSMWHRITSALA